MYICVKKKIIELVVEVQFAKMHLLDFKCRHHNKTGLDQFNCYVVRFICFCTKNLLKLAQRNNHLSTFFKHKVGVKNTATNIASK